MLNLRIIIWKILEWETSRKKIIWLQPEYLVWAPSVPWRWPSGCPAFTTVQTLHSGRQLESYTSVQLRPNLAPCIFLKPFFLNIPKIKHWLLRVLYTFRLNIYNIYINTLNYDHKCSLICFYPTWFSTSVLNNNINLLLNTSLLHRKALKWKHIPIILLGKIWYI